MIADVQLLRIAIAGIVGAACMVLATSLFHALGLPMVDFGRLLATKMLRYHSHGTRLGLVLHLVNGVVLAVIYALLVDHFRGPGWLLGLAYGAVLWLVMMLVVLPLLGDGPFGSKAPRGTAGSAFAVHMIYGLILGVTVSK